MIKFTQHRTHYKYESTDPKDVKYFEREMKMFIPVAVFSNSYKTKRWDGFVKFCNKETKTFPVGMLREAKQVCEEGEIDFEICSKVIKFKPKNNFKPEMYEHQKEAILKWFENFNELLVKDKFEIIEYQVKDILKGLSEMQVFFLPNDIISKKKVEVSKKQLQTT